MRVSVWWWGRKGREEGDAREKKQTNHYEIIFASMFEQQWDKFPCV